ncbi:sugar ABC transporter ATP-binding protein [Deinococcus altitudinis]|uniref:sugar ABC transporter ATP-binding protein n=1 Tax=Deinococcus altitudinis TaxID=468914 RepID=UPI00389128C3
METPATGGVGSPLLSLRGVGKRFGSQQAVQSVDLDLFPGEIHALVGENGAGKSTLIKLLTGVHAPTEGALFWNGEKTDFGGPAQAQRRGVRALYQDRQLVPGFSVLENLYLGSVYPTTAGRVNWTAMRRAAQQAQATLGLDLPMDVTAQHLTPTQHTLTELLRAVLVESRLLILDEPTASLAHEDARRLSDLVRQLSAQGTAILYVSHRLDEVLDLADRTTVLRGGQVVARFTRHGADADTLVAAMAGAPTQASTRAETTTVGTDPASVSSGPALLGVSHLRTRDRRVLDVSFELRAGEILGVYGLAGAGRTELLEALSGLRALDGGSVERRSGRAAGQAPVQVLIPEDRRGQGLILHLSVLENATLSTLTSHARWGVLSPSSQRRATLSAAETLQIRCTGPEQPVGELSGGNQQKVVFARALAERPELWLCDEPTQAVDVMTRRVIHGLLRDQAAAGAGVIFVTSDLSELLQISSRALVLQGGRSVAALSGDALTQERVLQACYQGADRAPDGTGPQAYAAH